MTANGMNRVPRVSVVVPARDEADAIVECIDAIAAQDHPLDDIEVIVVVDGGTRDRTGPIADAALGGRGFARTQVLRNQGSGTPSNLNLGLHAATGTVLCRVDARSRIPTDYVRRCSQLLADRPDLAVVGGAQVAVAPCDDVIGVGIARALNNRWGMGWSRYRRDAASGESDTVYLGSFRTADLRDVRGWDPVFGTNQDFDLNRRLAAARGAVWFEEGLPVAYVPRRSLPELFRQYVRFGRAKVRYWRHRDDRPQPRQVALAAGVPVAGALAVAAVLAAPPATRTKLVVAGLAAAAVFEAVGSSRPRGGVAAHGVALAASTAVAAGWLGGVWHELLRGEPSKATSR